MGLMFIRVAFVYHTSLSSPYDQVYSFGSSKGQLNIVIPCSNPQLDGHKVNNRLSLCYYVVLGQPHIKQNIGVRCSGDRWWQWDVRETTTIFKQSASRCPSPRCTSPHRATCYAPPILILYCLIRIRDRRISIGYNSNHDHTSATRVYLQQSSGDINE